MEILRTHLPDSFVITGVYIHVCMCARTSTRYLYKVITEDFHTLGWFWKTIWSLIGQDPLCGLVPDYGTTLPRHLTL